MDLKIIETILRKRRKFFTEIRQHIDVPQKIRAMFISCFIFLALYGLAMGASHSAMQAGASFVKLPILFLLTLAICAPSLHFFNIFFGSQQSFGQSIALILTAISTTSVLLVSLAPITLFFLMTSSQYNFFLLLNVGIFAIAGALGVLFLRDGLKIVTESEDEQEGVGARGTIFKIWVLVYAFVGSQMAFTLSPFVGEPGHVFILFRETSSNFYTYLLDNLFVGMWF